MVETLTSVCTSADVLQDLGIVPASPSWQTLKGRLMHGFGDKYSSEGCMSIKIKYWSQRLVANKPVA